MLSSGANTQKFEIRSSAIKSSLRFWWRAFQPLEGKELYKKEAKLFGSMDICCPFSIILMPDDNTFQYWRPGNSVDNELDHAWGEGVGYVFFPIYASARPKQRQPARIKPPDQKKPSKSGRTVAKPGGRFKIHINFISRESTPSQVGDVLCSLWLIENFGGLGGRTRRGAGCFKIEATDMEKNIDIGEVPDFYQSSFANAREYIASGLKVIFSRWFKGKIPSSLPTHTAFRHGHSQIMIFSGLRNRNYLTGIGAIRAMDAIGQRMRDFRHTNPHDEAEAMHHALTGEGRAKPDIKVLQKAQLGLPIRYNFRGCDEFGTRGRPEYPGGYETKGGVVYDERTNEAKIDDKKNVDRRASPLLISCHEFKGTPYAIACHFPAPILPKGQRIWLKAGYNAKDCYPKAPVKYDYVDKLLIKGDVVNGKQRKPLCTAFDDHWPVYDRTGEVFFETTEPEPKTPDTLATTQSTSKTKADIDPKEIKRIYLLQAPKQKHGLSWFLAEISGPSIGKNPKRQWPCDLWYLEGENLKREIITWYVRPKQLDSARDVKREQGALFLCTKEPDSNTKGNNMFLYNVTKPVLSNDSAK
jgi:CRISPR type III-B/RAMP module RAMP protein Cmr1